MCQVGIYDTWKVRVRGDKINLAGIHDTSFSLPEHRALAPEPSIVSYRVKTPAPEIADARRSSSPAATDLDVDQDVYNLLRKKTQQAQGLKKQVTRAKEELRVFKEQCKHLESAKRSTEQLLINQDDFASPDKVENLLLMTQTINSQTFADLAKAAGALGGW